MPTGEHEGNSIVGEGSWRADGHTTVSGQKQKPVCLLREPLKQCQQYEAGGPVPQVSHQDSGQFNRPGGHFPPGADKDEICWCGCELLLLSLTLFPWTPAALCLVLQRFCQDGPAPRPRV